MGTSPKNYIYDPNRQVTLIRVTPETKIIWNVQILDNASIEKIFTVNKAYKWEVDCDLDTFVIHQSEIEGKASRMGVPIEFPELSKRTLRLWKTLNSGSDQISQAISEIPGSRDSLLPIIAQDRSGRILMQAWGNRETLEIAQKEGLGCYFSRSRNKIWRKGEESGHIQKIESWKIQQAPPFSVIFKVEQTGSACHTGEYSCFFRELKTWNDPFLLPM